MAIAQNMAQTDAGASYALSRYYNRQTPAPSVSPDLALRQDVAVATNYITSGGYLDYPDYHQKVLSQGSGLYRI